MKTTTAIVIAVLLISGASWVYAGPVIYDNGGPDLVVPNGIISDFDADPPPGFTNPTQVADDFVLQTGLDTIADIHW